MAPAGGSRTRDQRGQVLSSLVAVAAVVAIVAGLLFLFGTRGTESAAKPPPAPSTAVSTATVSVTPPIKAASTPSPTPTASVPVDKRPPVEVYNNTRRKGLAEQVAERARAEGWKVVGADNWKGKIVTSTVYFPPGMQAEAQQLATSLAIPRIKDALENMKADRLTVILTADYLGR
ncbi:LytR C-terminal domain-containing protein [Kribbella sp. NBC_01245]|uniref:LytR C-terminal domain-containing protein n=1 Tax=Kribbella sp. NBC_01245 TaxID=2903578 RepID=UPI002E2C249F|nr:LytR C-terminal domain-containing protein [Kribbella sp. NBC_01245]